jgi:hypothetical protein
MPARKPFGVLVAAMLAHNAQEGIAVSKVYDLSKRFVLLNGICHSGLRDSLDVKHQKILLSGVSFWTSLMK